MFKSSMMVTTNNQLLSNEVVNNIPTRIDEDSAKMLAARLFEHYNRSKSGKIEPNEARTMIGDAYNALNKEYVVKDEDTDEYIACHDLDEDGDFSIQDFEQICQKFLCDPSGIGVNLMGEDSEKEQLLRYLYREVGNEPVSRALAKAEELFEKYDKDQDGYLDLGNLTQLVKDTYQVVLGSEQDFDEKEIQCYFGVINSKREGYVSKEEFELYLLNSLKSRNISF